MIVGTDARLHVLTALSTANSADCATLQINGISFLNYVASLPTQILDSGYHPLSETVFGLSLVDKGFDSRAGFDRYLLHHHHPAATQPASSRDNPWICVCCLTLLSALFAVCIAAKTIRIR
jgi:hypothetical protein